MTPIRGGCGGPQDGAAGRGLAGPRGDQALAFLRITTRSTRTTTPTAIAISSIDIDLPPCAVSCFSSARLRAGRGCRPR